MFNKEYISRTANVWGKNQEEVENILQKKYLKSIRINTIKQKKSTLKEIKKIVPNNSLIPIEWSPNCYYINSNYSIDTSNSIFSSGQCIIQNASSFIPVLELKPSINDIMIDLCAAPGAKSSHVAMLSNNKATLVLNDTSKTRFFKMRNLMNNYGVNAEYSLRDGRNISKYYPTNYFNKILVDAPCSGEANITVKDTWSYATIKRLQKIQINLLNEAFKLLSPEGRLVYCTCTIAPEENEQVVNTLLEIQPQAKILPVGEYPIPKMKGLDTWKNKKMFKSLNKTLRLLPGQYTKPFYVAVITKDISAPEDDSYYRLSHALTS